MASCIPVIAQEFSLTQHLWASLMSYVSRFMTEKQVKTGVTFSTNSFFVDSSAKISLFYIGDFLSDKRHQGVKNSMGINACTFVRERNQQQFESIVCRSLLHGNWIQVLSTLLSSHSKKILQKWLKTITTYLWKLIWMSLFPTDNFCTSNPLKNIVTSLYSVCKNMIERFITKKRRSLLLCVHCACDTWYILLRSGHTHTQEKTATRASHVLWCQDFQPLNHWMGYLLWALIRLFSCRGCVLRLFAAC